MESVPTKGVPSVVTPLSIATGSPGVKWASWVLKRHRRPVTLPSAKLVQNERLCSVPVSPKVNDEVLIWVVALNVEVEIIRTGIFPLDPELMSAGSAEGLTSMVTGRQLIPVGGVLPSVAAGTKYHPTAALCETGIWSTPELARVQHEPCKIQSPQELSQKGFEDGQPTPLSW